MDLSCGQYLTVDLERRGNDGSNISVVVIASASLILHQPFNLGMNSRESSLRDGKNAIVDPPLADSTFLDGERNERELSFL